MDAKGYVWLLAVIPVAVVAFSMAILRLGLPAAPLAEVVFVASCTAALVLAGVYGIAALLSPGRSSGLAIRPAPEPEAPLTVKRPALSGALRLVLGGGLGLVGGLLLVGGGLVGFECVRAYDREASALREASSARDKARAEESGGLPAAERPEDLRQYASDLSEAASALRLYAHNSFAAAWGCLGGGALCFWAGLTFALRAPRQAPSKERARVPRAA